MFIACGINHKTTPIHLREQLTIHESSYVSFVERLTHTSTVNEVAILSTCNRTELYCELSDQNQLLKQLASQTQVPITTLAQHWYTYREQDGIKHALRVASGLDSMMPGEPQIFGQFKQAYARACEAGSAKNTLKHVFPFVFRASKRVRNQSGINKHAISLASVAAQKILAAFADHAALNVLVIGTGEMAQLTLKYLSDTGVKHFWVASRTEDQAQKLALQYQAKSLNITALSQFLPQMDVIITATGCPVPFITKEMLRSQPKPLFFLDLALPRNVSPDVTQMPQVSLYNIDDLQAECEQNLIERQQAASLAEQLVEQELLNYTRWSNAEDTFRLISTYRAHMQQLTEQELSLALHQLKQGECEQNILKKLSHRLFKKLTHLPTLSLRQAALEGRTELLELAQSFLQEDHEAID